MSARSARRPVPALVFLLALAVLAVVVWVRVADRDSSAGGAPAGCASAPQLPANARVTVTVLNGTEKDGLAGAVSNAFVQYGFTAGDVATADTPLANIGSITYGPNGALSALLVSYYLPGATLQQDDRQDTGVTVTVGDTFVSLAPAAAIASSMAKAMVSQTPAAPASGATTGSAAASPAPTATCTTTPPAPTPSPSGSPAAS